MDFSEADVDEAATTYLLLRGKPGAFEAVVEQLMDKYGTDEPIDRILAVTLISERFQELNRKR
jgi:hypothetical protein